MTKTIYTTYTTSGRWSAGHSLAEQRRMVRRARDLGLTVVSFTARRCGSCITVDVLALDNEHGLARASDVSYALDCAEAIV